MTFIQNSGDHDHHLPVRGKVGIRGEGDITLLAAPQPPHPAPWYHLACQEFVFLFGLVPSLPPLWACGSSWLAPPRLWRGACSLA